MSNFEQVTISEFLWLLTRTQKLHLENGEPIPAINKDGQGKIEYCLYAPFMGIGDIEYYETFDDKAAVLFYNICKLHCLLNGNKRMAVETTIYFAWKNKRYSYISKKVLIDIAKRVVESDPNDKESVVWWVSRVFYGGIRKMTKWMMIKIVIRYSPKLVALLLNNLYLKFRYLFLKT